MSGLEIAAGGLSALGAGTSAFGTLMGANEEADALNAGRFNQLLTGAYRSQALKQAADEQRAAGQRKAFDYERNKDLALSSGRAIAAASGGGASDTSVVNTLAGVEAQGEYQKAVTMFGAESRALGLEEESRNALIGALNRDAATGYQAGQIRRRGKLDAAGTILSEAGAGLKKYGPRLPAPFGVPEHELALAEARRKGAEALAERSYRELERENERLRRSSERALWNLGRRRRYPTFYDWED